MKTTFGWLAILVLGGTCALAQSGGEKIAALKLTDVNLIAGVSITQSSSAGLESFRTLAPESKILMDDLSGYSHNGIYWTNGNSQFDILLGFELGDKKAGQYKDHMLFRIGLSYSPVTVISDYYQQSTRFPYDTLRSTRTGEEFYLDSTFSKNYSMEYGADLLSLNTSILWRTNPDARFTLFGGVGASFGVSLESYVSIGRYEYSDVNGQDLYIYDYNGEFLNHDFENEYYTKSTTIGFGVNAPMGVNWRIGKQNNLLKKLNLFYEFRPGLQFNQVPNADMNVRANMFHGIGLRYS